jgi:hypothetical protein
MRASMPLSRMMRSSLSGTVAVILFLSLRRRSEGNKKERDRVDPLFAIPTKNLSLI